MTTPGASFPAKPAIDPSRGDSGIGSGPDSDETLDGAAARIPPDEVSDADIGADSDSDSDSCSGGNAASGGAAVAADSTTDAGAEDRLGEAIEEYMEALEEGRAVDPEEFLARHADLGDDLREALEGLRLLRGMVSRSTAPGISGGTTPSTSLGPGSEIAGYRIVRELGRGGMGVVFEAVHVGLDRPVAFKVLRGGAPHGSRDRRRFLNEARFAASLHHTHIVPVFDVGQVDGTYYYAMQRIEGAGLDLVIRRLRRARAEGRGSGTGTAVDAGVGSGGGSSPVRPWSWWRARTWGGGSTTASLDADRPPGAIPIRAQGVARSDAPGPGPGPSGPVSPAGASKPESDAEGDADWGEADPEIAGSPVFEPPGGAARFRWVARVGMQAAQALAFAHQARVIHRDVKPSNLLIDRRGMVWVTDFGLARRIADPGVSQSGGFIGTPKYMSPEQAESRPVDPRSDVYSLGATLYELATLRPPFEGRDFAELARQITTRSPAPPRQIDPRVPRDLETVILKAMATRPGDRYKTAAEFADDLERFLNREPVRARRISALGRLWRFAARNPALSGVTTAAAVLIVSVATYAYLRIMTERDAAIQARNDLRQEIRQRILGEVSLLYNSVTPNKREQGLALIREAMADAPEPGQTAILRDMAVSFLGLRDIVPAGEAALGPLRGLAFLDGSRLAAESEDRSALTIWNLDGPSGADQERRIDLRGDRRGRASDSEPNRSRPSWLGGQFLPTAGGRWVGIRARGDGFVTLEPASGRLIEHPARNREIFGLDAAAQGNRLVTWDREEPNDGGDPSEFLPRLTLWDANRLDAPVASLGPIDFLPRFEIAPDGELVAVAPVWEERLRIHSGETGELLHELDMPSPVTALAVGRDRLVAAAVGGTIQLWRGDRGAPVSALMTHLAPVNLMRISPGGTLLVVSGRGDAIEVWDLRGGSLVASLPVEFGGPVAQIAFAPDGRSLAVSDREGRALFWRVSDPVGRTASLDFPEAPADMAQRGDGVLAVSVPGDGLWLRAASGSWSLVSREDLDPDPAAPDEENWSLDEARLRFDHEGRLVVVDAWSIRVHEIHSRGVGRRIRLGPAITEAALLAWAFPQAAKPPANRPGVVSNGSAGEGSNSGSGAGSASGGNAGQGSARATSGLTRLLRVESSPDGRRLAILAGNRVFVWHAERPDRVFPVALPATTVSPGAAGWWSHAAISNDGRRLRLVDAAQNLVVLELIHPPDSPDAASDSDSGSLVASAASEIGSGFEFPAGSLTWIGARLVPGLSEPGVTCLALSTDGTRLAVGDRSGRVSIQDAATGRTLHTLDATALDGPLAPRATRFDPSGTLLAVGTQERVRVWSLPPGGEPRPVVRLPARRGGVDLLAFDAAGQRLAVAGADTQVSFWDFPRVREALKGMGLDW